MKTKTLIAAVFAVAVAQLSGCAAEQEAFPVLTCGDTTCVNGGTDTDGTDSTEVTDCPSLWAELSEEDQINAQCYLEYTQYSKKAGMCVAMAVADGFPCTVFVNGEWTKGGGRCQTTDDKTGSECVPKTDVLPGSK